MQLATLTTPVVVESPVQTESVPPEAGAVTVSVMVAWMAVTVLPLASSMVTTGWVTSDVPEIPAAGWVVKTKALGAPVMLKLWLVALRDPLVAVIITPLA
jgi:hypothetical protein